MKPNLRRWTWALLPALVIMSGSGCRLLTTFPGCCAKSVAAEPATATATATVDVGGLVVRPGPVAIPAEGLSLRRALSSAGQVPQAGAVAGAALPSLMPPNIDSYLETVASFHRLTQENRFFRLGLIPQRAGLKNEMDESKKRKDDYEKTLVPGTQRTTVQELGFSAGSKAKHKDYLELLKRPQDVRAIITAAGGNVDAELAELVTNGDKFEDIRARLGTTSTTAIALPDLHLVSLTRRQAGIGTTYYFQYETAVADLGGEVRLVAGDLVQVLSFRQTPLAVQGAVPAGSSYRVQGLVSAVQDFPIDATTTLRDVFEKSSPRSNEKDVVAMVERNSGLSIETFVIPRQSATGSMSDFVMRPGDVVTMTRLPFVPVVTHGLVTGAFRTGGTAAATGGAPGCCLPGLHHHSHGQVRRQVENSGAAETLPVRTATEAFDTLRARTRGAR